MILVIDNYDSFVYNLVQYIGTATSEIDVRRNDRITLDEIDSLDPKAIVLSPGPGRPEDAGICVDVVRRFGGAIPIFGVCLGHQAIAAAFGATVRRAAQPLHGKTSKVHHDGTGLFTDVASPTCVTRYHSLAVEDDDLPDPLQVTARAEDGTIMGLRHREMPIFGLQFHPESILSEDGPRLIQNFLRMHGVANKVPTALQTTGQQIVGLADSD